MMSFTLNSKVTNNSIFQKTRRTARERFHPNRAPVNAKQTVPPGTTKSIKTIPNTILEIQKVGES